MEKAAMTVRYDGNLWEHSRVRIALNRRAAALAWAALGGDLPPLQPCVDEVIRWLCRDLDTIARLLAHLLELGPFAETPWPKGWSAPMLVLHSVFRGVVPPDATWELRTGAKMRTANRLFADAAFGTGYRGRCEQSLAEGGCLLVAVPAKLPDTQEQALEAVTEVVRWMLASDKEKSR
jgi:hypothetical protein